MSFKARVVALMYLFGCRNTVKGLLLSPSEEAVTCQGQKLELMCIANATFLRWTSLLYTEQGRVLMYSRYISSTDMSQQASSQIVNSTSFNVSRVSYQGMLPLVSRLLINTVSIGLNGTRVNCSDADTTMNNGNVSMVSTTINVIGVSHYPNGPEVTTTVNEYGEHSATILLEWTSEKGVIYNISVDPEGTIINSITVSSIQLTVSYNTYYNVSIVATSCGQNSILTVVEFHYGACDHPLGEEVNDSDSVQVIGYSKPILEGTSIMFYCPPGLKLTGSESIICMENGEWEPAPREVECKAAVTNCGPPSPPSNGHILPYTSTLEGAVVTYVCWNIHQEENTSLCTAINTTAVCNNHGNWEPKSQDSCSIFSERSVEVLSQDGKIAVASSITISTAMSILFFIIGFLCGHNRHKMRKKAETIPPEAGQTQAQIPYYDDVVLKQELELKPNVAYRSITMK